jgi:LuxR family maltose regulon positive regulatory protein
MGLFQTDKQTPVSLPEICAPRTGLIQKFDLASKKQYLYVHAPAGYGKTISTLLWIQKRNVKTAWMTLDAYDNTPVLFYRLFCRSLSSILPVGEDILEGLKSPAFNASPVEYTVDALSRLAWENAGYALVLDDLHTIVNEEILKSLPYVIRRLPLAVTVLFLSRNSLPEPFSVLQEQDKISFLGDSELAFKSSEIRKHFANYGRFITEPEAEKIYEYTEGWIIALNAIAMSGEIDISYKAQSMPFSSFIEKNIWSKLEPGLQNFLLTTSVPDKFSLELCEYITGSGDCKQTLDRLIGGNVNISLVGLEYRYHNLFLEFLRDKLNQSDLDKRGLNKKVADYYLSKGDFLTAKRYAVKSGDMAAISQAVRNFYSLTTFSLDEYIDFHTLYNLQVLPEAICDKMPLLYIPHIFFAYAQGDIQKVNYFFDRLYPLFPVIAATHPEIMEHVNSIVMLDCRIRMRDLPSRFQKLPSVAHEHIKLQSPTFTVQMPFLHRCVRDFYELTDPAVRQAVREFSAPIIKENVDLMFTGAEAGLLMERNRLHDALGITLSLKETVKENMSPEFVYAIHILTAELYLLLNQKEKHAAAVKEVRRYIKDSSAEYLQKNVAAYEARTAIMDGDKAVAEKWLEQYYVNDSSFNGFYKIFRNFTTVRAYILLMQTDKAVAALEKIRAMAVNYDRLLDMAEADALLSVAEWASGRKKEAQARLLNLLAALKPFGFIRVIANEGKAVLPILSSAVRKIRVDSRQPEGLDKFAKEVYLAAYEQSKHFKGLIRSGESGSVKLSKQQIRVLELLAKGYRFAEIVEETGLSLNTIRTHAKKTYQKLDVNNSADAILRARQLGLMK